MGSNQLRTSRTHAVGRIRELAHNLLHEIFTLPARAIILGDASGAVISMGFGVAVSDADHDLWVERTHGYGARCQQCIAHGRFEIVGVERHQSLPLRAARVCERGSIAQPNSDSPLRA